MVGVPVIYDCSLAIDWVLGIAIGIMFTISPLWIGETCRPELRGFWLCFCKCNFTWWTATLLTHEIIVNTSIIWGQMLV